MNRSNAWYKRVNKAVEAEIGDDVICKICGATLKNYDTAYCAGLLDRCPGFTRIDEVRSAAIRRIGLPRRR